MRQKLTILIILSLLFLAGCINSGTDKSKELELKEKELALKEKELELKQKAPKEGDSDKTETTEKTTKTPDTGGGKLESIYTDLAESKCKTTSDDESDVITQECPGVAGYKLEVAEHDAQKTINVLSPSGKTYDLDFQGKVSGGLSTLGEKAEWRVKKSNGKIQPVGLITRFNFSKTGDEKNLTSYLIVTKFDGDKICITDIVKTKDDNAKARELADVAPTKPCL
jgi:outer membrane murein-binding lipoprotein Lpp